MRKILIILAIVIVLAIAIAIRLGVSRKPVSQERTEKIVAVEITPVARGNVASTCELLGTIKAEKTAQVFPETMGRITKILIKEGSYVTKDSRLMALRNEAIGFEYEEGYIKAPISGNVANIMVDVGSMVTPQAPVAVVVEYSYVEVTFDISENAMGCIEKGGKVQIEIDAIPDRSFYGKVSEISPVIDPMTRTIRAKAMINNPKKLLKPGMTARVILTIGSKENVLTIPRDALLDSYVFIVKDSTAQRRDVKIGLIGDKYVEIISGIEPGEDIVVVGQQRLSGGEKLRPTVQEKLTGSSAIPENE